MQWGERSGSRRVKPGLTMPGAAQPTWWPSSWTDGASSSPGCVQLRWDEGAPRTDTPGTGGVFLTGAGIHGMQGVPKAGAPTSSKEGCRSRGCPC